MIGRPASDVGEPAVRVGARVAMIGPPASDVGEPAISIGVRVVMFWRSGNRCRRTVGERWRLGLNNSAPELQMWEVRRRRRTPGCS